MKMKKRMMLILCVLVSLLISGCDKQVDKRDLAQKTLDNLNNLESYSSKMNMNLTMNSGEIDTVKVTLLSEQKTRRQEAKTQVDVKLGFSLMGLKKETNATLISEVAQDGLIVYANDGREWKVISGGALGDVEQFDPMGSLTEYLSKLDGLEQVGREKIDGVTAARFDGTMDMEALKSIIAYSMLKEATGLDLEKVSLPDDTVEVKEGIPISLWIDVDKALPVKYSIDFSKALDSVFAQMENGGETVKTDATAEILITGYDNVEKIEIPQEAKDAL